LYGNGGYEIKAHCISHRVTHARGMAALSHSILDAVTTY
jgi:hypothetical protein